MDGIRRLAVKLRPAAEKMVKQGHPWVFSDSIRKVSPEGEAGDLAILFDQRTDQVFAIGLYDPHSPIRVKIIHQGGPLQIGPDFFKDKLSAAFAHRAPLLETGTNAYRLLFGENDGFPGLIADIYDRTGVMKIYSAAWFPYLELLAAQIIEVTGIKGVVLRLSRKLEERETAFQEGEILAGKPDLPEVVFNEYGVLFRADVLLGHKTGFFLDHRANRRKIGQYSAGKSVLDVFSYAGGFSVHALAGGAEVVTSIDVSRQALELAKENAGMNPHTGRHRTIAGDAFELLRKMIGEGKKYDVVVIDPPSFAKRKKEVPTALKKYAELAELGARLTRRGGLLMLASCSSRVGEADFLKAHQEAFRRLDILLRQEAITRHDIDHPVRFPEGAYLKSVYYRLF